MNMDKKDEIKLNVKIGNLLNHTNIKKMIKN